MTKVAATYRIPYDVDIWWDGGCGGKDRLSDGFGNSVLLLVSDSGTAYVCPEGHDERWRIYVDSCGFEKRLKTLPGGEEDTRVHIGGWPTFTDILSCGLSVNSALAGGIVSMGQCGSGDGRLPTMFDGQTFDLGPYRLEFDEGQVKLKGFDTTYWVDESGMTWRMKEIQNLDSEGYYTTNVTTMATSKELSTMIEFLEREKGLALWIKKHAIEVSIRVFKGEVRMLDDIDSFEASCRNYFLRGGT